MRDTLSHFGAAALVLVTLACAKPEPKVTRDQVLPLLQQEAVRTKADGEKVANLGVKATWTIAAVEVQEQAGNEAQPFKGSIRFKIASATHALDAPATTTFEKTFNYVYDVAQKKWLFRM